MNQLFYGDNLHVLRDRTNFPDGSIDLVYLDPPFNSKRDYNVLFKSPKGMHSTAQIEAFEDTWHWNEQAEREFDDLLHQGNTDVAEMMKALRSFLGENDVMAYLTMMANRLLELHRVLKPDGSLYLHCDPTASHYLKIVLDGVFGKERFLNEIVWHYNTGGKGRATFLRKHDTIFWYSKGAKYTFNRDEISIPRKVGTAHLRHGTDEDGREYYEDYSARKSGKLYRWYLDEGLTPMDVWTDIQAINPAANEPLGYPTQKPLALLERIVSASSNEGETVLDPFCGCGTAVDAAQKLKRKWIGIDITHLAISLIEKRLKDRYVGRCKFEVHGTPRDIDAARDLANRDKYQFQWWAVSLVDAQPFQGKKKGADTGIDGLKYFRDAGEKEVRKIVVSVKGGGNLKADDVRALNHVREREKADIALFISLAEPTAGMLKDAAAAGLYTSSTGKKFARVQMLTIDGLLSGKQRAEHPDYQPSMSFKKAERDAEGKQPNLPL